MSKKSFYPICLALVLALAGFAQAELLVNGDFEAGLDSWKTWGSGSGSGAGGWFFSSAFGATVIEDGTAQSGSKYVEIGFTPPDVPWWGYVYAFQEYPVTEGKTYQISAWFRDGDADGATSLIAGGGTIVWEWRVTAPIGGPDTEDRGDLVDIDGDGVGGNSDKIHYVFDLTEEWTYASTTEVAPPGAKGVSIIFGAPSAFVNIDIDNVSFLEAAAPNALIENWEATVALASPGFLATNVENGTYDIGAFSGDMTYEFVVNSNPDEQEASMALIGRLDFGDTRVGLKYEQWSNTGTYGATVFGVADHDYGVATKPGVDTHLVFVSSGGETALYVNGAYRGSIGAEISLSGVVGIGRAIREDGTFVDNFDGSIFGVAIYDTALSADQIQAHSDAYFMPLPDVTAPGDPVQGVPDDGDWPGGEPPAMVIDNDSGTKFLHFGGNFDPNEGPSGFRVTASATQGIVTGLTFTTANDSPERDPVAFELSGSNESIDGPYTLIASGDIVDFNDLNEWPRFTKNETVISFDNDVVYAHYQVLFTAIRDAASANSMQIAEVELLGIILGNYNASPADGAIVVPDMLSWSPGENAVSHDVYFGTSSPPAFIGNQPETSYAPVLEYATTYYWQVDAVEADGTIRAGSILSFTTPQTATAGTILREVWTGIGGTSVSDLTGNANYPANPSYSDEVTLFETPTNFDDNFGSRVHGYLHPETSGDYLFWIATDDSSELWLSTDESPANAVVISTVSGWAGSRDFDSGNVTPSGPVSLVGGQKYYISGIYKEGGGGDNLAVAWEGPDSPTRSVIDGYYLSPYVYLWAWVPSPADGADNVLIGSTLSWAPAVTAATNDVYFGTSSPPAFIGNQEATTYYPGALETGTTYYWQVDAVEADGTTTAGDLWSFTTGFSNVALDIRIATGDDDVEERLREDRNGDLDMGSSDLEFPYEDFPIDDLQRVGMRFVGVGIPQGAQIVSSYIEFEVDEIKDDANSVVNVIIDGQLTPDAEPFVNEFMNVSQRPAWTSTVVPWSVPYWTEVDVKSQTPDISVLVQELVNQADWASGNAMVFTIQDDPANPSEGNRAAESYNGESSAAPLLHIEAVVEVATGPSPANGAENVPTIGTALSWWPGAHAVSHDGYLGTSSPPAFIGNTPEVTFDPGVLAPSTTYYWQANAVDADGTIHTSDIWSFTTELGEASQPDPADNAVAVALDKILSWKPGVTAATHDVYFGTTSPPPLIGNQTESSFDPGPLEPGTTYYWQVDEIEADGTTVYTGDVLSFETLTPPPPEWTSLDIAITGGSTSYDPATGTFTITAGGADIWGNADQFRFCYQTPTLTRGDCTLIANVVSFDVPPDGNLWQKAGLMIRDTLDAGSINVFIAITGGSGDGASFQWRTDTDGGSDSSRNLVVAPPASIKLVRKGDTFTSYVLMDGQWQQQGDPATVVMGDEVYVGLAVTSHKAGAPATVVIDNVSITTPNPNVAASPDPVDGTTEVPKTLTLSWTPGGTAVSHDVYLSADEQAVIDGTAPVTTVTQTSYTPADLVKGVTYYWRVDEVEADGTIHTGPIWSFTVTTLGR